MDSHARLAAIDRLVRIKDRAGDWGGAVTYGDDGLPIVDHEAVHDHIDRVLRDVEDLVLDLLDGRTP